MVRYEVVHVHIPERLKGLAFPLFFSIARIVMSAVFQSAVGRISLAIVVALIPLRFFSHPGSLSAVSAFAVFLGLVFLVLLPLAVCLEETLHAGICVRKGKPNFAKDLTVGFLTNSRGCKITLTFVAIRFEGEFSLLDQLHIHGGAPLLLFSVWCIVLCLVMPLRGSPLGGELAKFVAVWGLFPLSSLLPFRFHLSSDGFRILELSRRRRLPMTKLFKELCYGAFVAACYLFLGSKQQVGRCSNLPVNHALAYDHMRRGHLQEAANILEGVLHVDPQDAAACNNIAWCYAELNRDLDRAILLADKAAKLAPEEPTYVHTLAWSYYKKGERAKAVACINKAITLDPHNQLFKDHLLTMRNTTGVPLDNQAIPRHIETTKEDEQ